MLTALDGDRAWVLLAATGGLLLAVPAGAEDSGRLTDPAVPASVAVPAGEALGCRAALPSEPLQPATTRLSSTPASAER